MLEVAEDKAKIGLMDLIRLLLPYEAAAAHVFYKHWETFDITIFQYLLCIDIKDPNNKVMSNYHLISLKMLGNVYQTQTGIEFISEADQSAQVIQFCEYSFGHVNPKVVYTAGVVLFNHMVTYKRDLSRINDNLYNAILKIMEVIVDVTDKDAAMALLLAETRILFKNQDLLSKVIVIKDKFVKVHKECKIQDNAVKQAISDVLSLVGEQWQH